MSDNISWMRERLDGAGNPLLIDGGMGTELQRAGVPMDGKVWSGTAVLTHPEAVRATHEAFIEAGAEVIIANTFATARHMLEPGGFGEQVREINLGAVELAQQARANAATGPVELAGSICEWSPSDSPRWHSAQAVGESAREQAELLAEAGVDLIALEMCERIDYSVACAEAVLETGLPLWLGLSAKSFEGRRDLSAFDYPELDFADLVERLARFPAMVMNIMHTPIADIDAAQQVVRRYWPGPIGVYPESGHFTMPDWHFVDIIAPDELATLALAWRERGIRLTGGCCGLGPDHIAAMRQAFA